MTGVLLPATSDAAVGIVLASGGYPEAPLAGAAIAGLAEAEAGGALVFHAGTARDGAGRWRVRGGRVLTVVGRGPDLAAARDAAERGADAVTFAGLQRRHDIAGGPLAAGAGTAR
jgi:phosphoribosylamine--glycine ligase